MISKRNDVAVIEIVVSGLESMGDINAAVAVLDSRLAAARREVIERLTSAHPRPVEEAR